MDNMVVLVLVSVALIYVPNVAMHYDKNISYILRDWDFCWNIQPELILHFEVT